jgi:hypothetical protein
MAHAGARGARSWPQTATCGPYAEGSAKAASCKQMHLARSPGGMRDALRIARSAAKCKARRSPVRYSADEMPGAPDFASPLVRNGILRGTRCGFMIQWLNRLILLGLVVYGVYCAIGWIERREEALYQAREEMVSSRSVSERGPRSSARSTGARHGGRRRCVSSSRRKGCRYRRAARCAWTRSGSSSTQRSEP